jgi:hypothetical protein
MFIDTFLDEPFINVSFRVGKTGVIEDLLMVQLMLKFLFTESPSLKKVNPVKGEITVTGRPARDTTLLIAAYQKHHLHRPKPQGYVNKAEGTDQQKRLFTIVQMNLHIEMILAAQQSPFRNALELLANISPLAASLLALMVP